MNVDISRFDRCHVLVIGDLMIDEYLWGEVDRISPEAPVQVVSVLRDSTTLGGAGDQITLIVNGSPFTVNAGGMTLSELRDAINDAPDNSGVSATIISENDTVWIEEIKLGDNDNLAAMITLLMDADLLINLTDIDGLYTKDPRTYPDAELISTVSTINKETEKMNSASG